MAEIILPRRFNAQPQATVELTPYWKRGAVIVAPLTEQFARDAATRNNFSPGAAAAPALVTRNQGRALYFNGSTTRLQSARAVTPGAAFTVFVWCRPAALSAYARLVEADYASGFFLGLNTSGKYCWIVNNAIPEGCVGGQPTTGKRDFVCGVFDGSSRILYVNGIQVAISAATAPSAARTVYIGAYGLGGAPSYAFNGDIDTVGIFDRVFAPAEIFALYQNPWQLFRAPARKLWPDDARPGLSGVAAIQVNSGSAVEIAQHHVLAIAGLTQAGGIVTGKIEQNQTLATAALVQSNLNNAAGITRGVALAGAVIATGRTLISGEISQAHIFSGKGWIQGKTLPRAVITQTHTLVEANLVQFNASGVLPISVGSGMLAGTPSAQVNAGATGIVTQIHLLVATFCSQINKASAKAISDGVVTESALISKPAEAIHTKKPGIPVGAPPWLKIMLEILTGRRGNRITLPAFRTLTFSAPPTQVECEALYAYINSVRDSLEQLISRMDG